MEWAIGDVHGYYDTLVKLLAKIRQQDDNPTYIFVGDYCDRGPSSDKVVELAIQLQSEGHKFIRGNHDDIFDWILNDKCYGDMQEHIVGFVNPQKVIMWWMQNGLGNALRSYNFDTMRLAYAELPHDWDLIVDEIRDLVPKSHRDFYRSLPLYFENDTHFCVHAYLDPSIVLTRFGLSSVFNKQDRIEEALWTRFPRAIKSVSPQWGKIGVFGHTPTFYYDTPDIVREKDLRLIDTGPAFNGKLSGLCLQTDEVLSVDVND